MNIFTRPLPNTIIYNRQTSDSVKQIYKITVRNGEVIMFARWESCRFMCSEFRSVTSVTFPPHHKMEGDNKIIPLYSTSMPSAFELILWAFNPQDIHLHNPERVKNEHLSFVLDTNTMYTLSPTDFQVLCYFYYHYGCLKNWWKQEQKLPVFTDIYVWNENQLRKYDQYSLLLLLSVHKQSLTFPYPVYIVVPLEWNE